MKNQFFRVRDLRDKNKFWIDNDYINGYAKLCGADATLVYISLCRHANYYTQTAFPSQSMIAKEFNITIRRVRKGIKQLVLYNIIQVEQERKEDGRFSHYVYTLLDKSQWQSLPCVKKPPTVNNTKNSPCVNNRTTVNRAAVDDTINIPKDVNIPKEDRDISKKIKFLDFVYLTKEEYLKLVNRLGKNKTDELIESLNNYIGSKGKRYKSHYFTILNWHRLDEKRKKISNNSKIQADEDFKESL
jgi:hypothetical protein